MKNIFSYLTILPLLIYYQIKLIQSQKEDQCDKSWIDELFLEFEHSRLLSRSILIFFLATSILFLTFECCLKKFKCVSTSNYHSSQRVLTTITEKKNSERKMHYRNFSQNLNSERFWVRTIEISNRKKVPHRDCFCWYLLSISLPLCSSRTHLHYCQPNKEKKRNQQCCTR